MSDVRPPNHDCLFTGERWHDDRPDLCDVCHTGYETTIAADGIKCPYCGYVDPDSWEWCQHEDKEQHECGRCELVFMAYQCVMIDYRAAPLPDGERNPEQSRNLHKTVRG